MLAWANTPLPESPEVRLFFGRIYDWTQQGKQSGPRDVSEHILAAMAGQIDVATLSAELSSERATVFLRLDSKRRGGFDEFCRAQVPMAIPKTSRLAGLETGMWTIGSLDLRKSAELFSTLEVPGVDMKALMRMSSFYDAGYESLMHSATNNRAVIDAQNRKRTAALIEQLRSQTGVEGLTLKAEPPQLHRGVKIERSIYVVGPSAPPMLASAYPPGQTIYVALVKNHLLVFNGAAEAKAALLNSIDAILDGKGFGLPATIQSQLSIAKRLKESVFVAANVGSMMGEPMSLARLAGGVSFDEGSMTLRATIQASALLPVAAALQKWLASSAAKVPQQQPPSPKTP